MVILAGYTTILFLFILLITINNKDKTNKILKDIKIPLIMTFIVGLFLSANIIGMPIITKLEILFVSFLPFIAFLIIYIICNKFKNDENILRISKTITIILMCLMLMYYAFATIIIFAISVDNPITNPKYYKLFITDHYIFPKEIPNNAENIEFYYGAIGSSLYYIDKDMTINEFDEKYKDKAIWIGYKDEYKENYGLLGSVFYFTPVEYENENDFVIYLIKGRCDASGYCNHGNLLLAGFNEKTNEIIYRSEDW